MILLTVLILERIVVFLRMLNGEYATKSLFWCCFLIPFFSTASDLFIFLGNSFFLFNYSGRQFTEFVKFMYHKMK